ncbi:MAG: zinc ribbon domain-containing protein [Candidatus Thermoplasmatota archaeon]|nr:zinc ribbon domain-containing protein [Candidatus Thermoplasmatota archaeon]
MYGKMKRIIVATMVAIMMLSAFPLMVNAAEEDAPAPGRAGEITVNEIAVNTQIPFEENGTNGNGEYSIGVNFTLAHQMMNVNVTINVTHDGGSEANTSEKGNLSPGDHVVLMNDQFNFTDPGLYNITASIEGWLNGTGMVNGSANMTGVNFTTIIDFMVNISIDAPEKDGFYGQRTIGILATVTNMGNSNLVDTNVSIEVLNVSSQIAEQFTESFEEIAVLAANMVSDPVEFFWEPSAQGAFNITINASNTGVTNGTTLQVQIKNIPDIHLVNLTGFGDTGGVPSTFFDVTVLLNNTGNAVGTGTVHLEIYPAADPANILIDLTNTSGNITPEEGTTSTREEASVIFQGLSIQDEGSYKVKASLVGTAEVLIKDLVIGVTPNLPPELLNVSLTPDPTAANVLVDEVIVFSAVYKDFDADVGTLKVYIDNVSHDMVSNGSTSWGSGVTFTYNWTATAANHSYHFVGTDANAASVLKEHVDYNFTIHEPTDGWLYGKVTDADGNVSNASVIIYITAMNATNVTYIDKYYNNTADSNGSFSEFLPFSDTKYVIMLDETWLADNGYDVPAVNKQLFEINALKPKAWVNYTLVNATPPPPDTYLVGTALAGADNLTGVTVTVEIFNDVIGNMSVVVDSVNATVNTTTRTWMNLTATSGVNGSYAIKGVPHGLFAIDAADVTGTRVYRHDVEKPDGASRGWWLVTYSKTDYLTEKISLEFKEGKNTTWNVTLPLDITNKYNITGKVDPIDAKVMIGTTVVTVVNGSFTITGLIADTYELTFSATNYNTTNETVIITDADWDLGTVILVWNNPDVEPPTFTMTLGPWMENKDDGKPGIKVSFTYDGELWSAVTGSNGIAEFKEFPLRDMPAGITVTREYGDHKETGTDWDYDEFEGETIKSDPDGNSVLLIVAIVVIVFIIIILVVLAMKSKGSEEDLYDDEIREYECPSCGAIVTSDMDTCPECGESFEEEEFRCPECSEMVEKDATICDSCGSEFEMPEKVEEEIEEGEEGDELEPPEEDVPEAIDEFDVEDEDDELEGVEDMEDELEEESLDMDDDELDELEDL